MDRTQREMFENQDEADGKSQSLEDPTDIYDTFYASIYDKLFSTPDRISFEKSAIEEYALAGWPVGEAKLLDACCGTSPHSEWLCKTEIDLVGFDSSEAMLKKARERCTRGRYYRGDITRSESFPPKSFSHAMLLYFSIYQFRNPKLVLDNLYSWLKPGGVLVIHLVDPNKFDPILDAASPWVMFSLQKYAEKRVMDSDVSFNDFKYRARLVKDEHDEDAVFEETMTFKEPEKYGGVKYREHKHRLYMPTIPAMLDTLASSGFTRHEMIDMTPAGYEYQYLVFLSK